MGEFLLLSTDIHLWQASTKAKSGLLDFCPAVMQFQVWMIMPAQLVTISQAGAWGEAEKPQWDMAFMLIALNTNAIHEQVFGLTALWAHPHQACLHTLEEVVHKLLLLVDDGPDWPYAFVQMNDTVSHAPLSSEENIGAMTDSMPSTNACSQLHQLQVWKSLQHSSWVAWPEGLNGELETLQFTFKSYHSGMLPPWMNLPGPTSNRVGPQQCPAWQHDNHPSDSHYHIGATPFSSHLCWAFLWHHHGHQPVAPGGLGAAAVGFPHHLDPVSLHSMPNKRDAISSLGGSDSMWSNRGSLWTQWGGPNHPSPDGKPYSGVTVGRHTRRCTQYHSHQPLTNPANHAKNPKASSTFPIPQLQAPPRVDPARLPEEVLWLQGQMNVAWELLLTTRATMDSHCKELELNAELAMHMNVCRLLRLSRRPKWAMQPRSRKPRCATQLWSRRLRCATQPQSNEWSCAAQPRSRRLRWATPPILVSYSKPTGKICWH